MATIHSSKLEELTRLSGQIWQIVKEYLVKNMTDGDFEELIEKEKKLIEANADNARFIIHMTGAYNNYLGEVNGKDKL